MKASPKPQLARSGWLATASLDSLVALGSLHSSSAQLGITTGGDT